jgi:glycerol-3-phosphate dehydrogenase (NAD(P)+)
MILVMGAGAFGTALAISLGAKNQVTLWSRDRRLADAIQTKRRNDLRLPNVSLPAGLTVSAQLPSETPEAVLVAIPTQKLRAFGEAMKGQLPEGIPLVACCKGIELSTGKRPTEILQDAFPSNSPAVLTGPSFADDIARGLPTALTLAARTDECAQFLQTCLSTQNLRLYRTTDLVGAELGGALKNVVAIACGSAIGAGLGDSARAALMTRGFAEIVRISEHLGADPVTLNGLSGFGDLVLTCSSDQSRNYRFGLGLGRGEPAPTGMTIEGVATAKAVSDLADRLQLELPITRVVNAMASDGLKVEQAMDMLLSRPLKEETC